MKLLETPCGSSQLADHEYRVLRATRIRGLVVVLGVYVLPDGEAGSWFVGIYMPDGRRVRRGSWSGRTIDNGETVHGRFVEMLLAEDPDAVWP